MRTLFTNAIIVPMSKPDYVIENGALGIADDKIDYVGQFEPQRAQLYDKVIDCSNKIIMPGLINTHCHAAMSLLRGYSDDLPLQTWLHSIWPLEAKFTPEHVSVGCALALVELIKSGTTCFLDMYDNMNSVADVVLKSGMRSVLCRGVIGVNADEQLRQKKLDEAVSFAKQCQELDNNRISAMLSPHAPYTCDPNYIRKFVYHAQEIGVPLHTHMSETQKEVQENIENYGSRPVEHLRKLGFFDGPALVAHAVHVNDEEVAIMKQYDVKISHNLGSNLKLGSGIAPIPMMLDAGIRPSLGTDGAASNNNLDMIEEMRLAALVHKGVNQNPELLPAYKVLEMGTIYGAESLFLDKEIGSLEPGKLADFIILDSSKVHMCPNHNVISDLIYTTMPSDIQDSYVNGRAIMLNRRCISLDEEKIMHRARYLISQLI